MTIRHNVDVILTGNIPLRVTVTVDIEAIACAMAAKATRNKSGNAQVLRGAVKVCVPRENINGR